MQNGWPAGSVKTRKPDSGVRRYPDGGGLAAAERARREQVRLAAELTGLYREETR